MTSRTINGWKFEYDEDNAFYQSRGDVRYDEDHDETPEPALWEAAQVLQAQLLAEGFDARASYSEKGWVEVVIH